MHEYWGMRPSKTPAAASPPGPGDAGAQGCGRHHRAGREERREGSSALGLRTRPHEPPGRRGTPFPEPSPCTQPRCERPGAPGAGPGRTAGPNPVKGGLARRFKGRSGSGKGCEERRGGSGGRGAAGRAGTARRHPVSEPGGGPGAAAP